LITDLFDIDEPLRMSLRRSAVYCIENQDKKEGFIQLISLVRLSKDIGLITDMNAGILFDVLSTKIEELDSVKDKDNHVDIISIIKPEEVVPTQAIQTIESPRVEKKMPNTSITINNNTQNIKTINNISMDIGSRRKKIMEIVKTRGAVTINEFMDSIKGCSSKTIQRELTSLVLSGNLKKTGERRWSKYSLK